MEKKEVTFVKNLNGLSLGILLLLLGLILMFFRPISYILSDDEKVEVSKERSKEELRKKLQKNVKEENWALRRIHNPKLVDNHEGVYFTIDLRDAITKEILKFNIEKYVIEDFEERFMNGLADFADKVTSILEEEDYEIFIVGSADQDKPDNGLFQGNLDPRYSGRDFTIIEYFEKIGNSETQFHTKKKKHYVNNTFGNNDLPNLRAAFLRYKFKNSYKLLKEPIILEGSVEEFVTDAEKRNGTLILFTPDKFMYPKVKN
jgi:hypothetical protein